MNRIATRAEVPFNPVRFWLAIGALCAVVITGSVLMSIRLHRSRPAESPLPVLGHIGHDLETMERSGATVHLASLRGKVCVMAYVYTVCPHGCATIIGDMLKLKNEFGGRGDFHLVSVSVAPERDNAEMLRAFANGIGLKPGDPWWFLTGDRAKLWGFMTDELKLEPSKPIPEAERLSALDLYAHDLRVVLVDRAGNIRGYYSIFHPEGQVADLFREKLKKDVRRLLEDPSS